jgi:hypothetical protein
MSSQRAWRVRRGRRRQAEWLLVGVILAAGVPMLLVQADGGSDEAARSESQSCEAQGTCGPSDEAPADEAPFVCDFVEKLDFYERLGVAKDADDRSLKKVTDRIPLIACTF